MMSEYFVEKYYGEGDSAKMNKVPPRFERIQTKNSHIRKYHKHLEKNKLKTCGYKPINKDSLFHFQESTTI